MTWRQRFRIRHYLQTSIWIPPVVAMVLAMLAVRLLYWFEQAMGSGATLGPETTRAVLGTLAGAMFTLIVFVCSSLLLVLQLASSYLTPRVIGTMFRDRVTKISLSVFVFSFTFVLGVLVRVETAVPPLTTQVAAYSCAASLGVFLYLIDHVGKLLRQSGAFHSVAAQAHLIIDSIYRQRLSDPREESAENAEVSRSPHARTVTSTKDGVVLAFDIKGLVALGTRHDCLVELVPEVGDFVAPGEPLFRIYGNAEVPDSALLQSIAVGAERTMDQDPAFAFRVFVDIASKALSAAVNDPTTAVLAIDRIHYLLRDLGSRRLDDCTVRDAARRVRLIYRTPDWEDFVRLAVTEIRHFGAVSIQVARRLRAMLVDLIQTLPEERAAPLQTELKLLHRAAERFFVEPEDRALAETGDVQGVGGLPELSQRSPGDEAGLNHASTR